MRRVLLTGVTALAIALPIAAPALDAQSRRSDPAKRFPRRILMSLGGAITGAALAGMYLRTSQDNRTPGTCTEKTCVGIVAIGGGALVGYLIGREFDQLHALRYRGGAPLSPPTVSAAFSGEPILVAARDSLVAVAGASGVQMYHSRAQLRSAGRRANGVRGISAIELSPINGALLVGSPVGFYVFPPQSGAGVLVREGAASAIAAGSRAHYVAFGRRVEVVPSGADTTRSWPGLDLGASVVALSSDDARGILWAAVDSGLVALRPAGDSLERVGGMQLGVTPRRISVHGIRIALALGERGALLVEASDLAAPRRLGEWKTARFVYDVALVGDRLFAAAGTEGVYVVEAASGMATIGLARELGFAGALASRDGFVYVLDRSTNALRRIPIQF